MAEISDAEIRVVAAVCDWTRHHAEHVLSQAVELAPKDEATLRRSAHVAYVVNFDEQPDFAVAKRLAVELAKVGQLVDFHAVLRFATPYAAAQHEGSAIMLRASGPVRWTAREYTTPGTGKKYLERPLFAEIPAARETLDLSVKVALRG